MFGSILCSCASVSSYQTAKTLPGGTFRVFVAAGYGLNPEQQPSQVGGAQVRDVRLPVFEGGVRLGLADRWDLGLKVTVPGTGTVDFKHQFYRSEDWEFAIGLGGSYVAVTASSANEESQLNYNVVDIILPAYVSYSFSPTFALYGNPKYVHRIYPRSDVSTQHLVGSAVGLRWGDSIGLFLEGAFLMDLRTRSNLVQGGLALFIGGGASLPRTVPTKEWGTVQQFFPRSKTLLVRPIGRVNWKLGDTLCSLSEGLERACGRVVEIRGGRYRVRLQWSEKSPVVGDRVVRQ